MGWQISAQDSELNAIAGNTISVPTAAAFIAVLLASGSLKGLKKQTSVPLPLPALKLTVPSIVWIGHPRVTNDPAHEFDGLLAKGEAKMGMKRPATSHRAVGRKVQMHFFRPPSEQPSPARLQSSIPGCKKRLMDGWEGGVEEVVNSG